MKPRFFRTPAAFRTWLERNHDTATELYVGFHRKASGKPSITWPEAVDQALCFGWIDGVRKGIDETSYMIRFTPRKARSIWSAVNTRRVAELERLGLMTDAGRAAFARRDEKRTAIYSYERRERAAFSPEQERAFKAKRAAWEFFQAQPPGYRRTATHWVISAKRPETRARRLATLIECSARRERLPQLTQPRAR